MSNDGRRRDDEERIDRAIDGAVREMLDVEPLPGLRGRVLRRIEGDSRVASDVASAFRRKILLFGVPLAAAAILILAVLLPRMREDVQPQPAIVAVIPPVQAPPPAPQHVTVPSTSHPVERTPVVARVTPPRAGVRPLAERTIAAADVTVSADNARTTIEPLNPIAPIEMTPIAEHRYAPADIAVRPLNPITELQIAPLTPPRERN